MDAPEPTPDPPTDPKRTGILPLPPEAWPRMPGGAQDPHRLQQSPPPLPYAPPFRPAPMFTILSYVLGLSPIVGALKASRDVSSIPGDEFASLISTGILGLGMIGALLFGMTFSLLGYSRGEPRALVGLWLIPLLAVVMVGLSAFLYLI